VRVAYNGVHANKQQCGLISARTDRLVGVLRGLQILEEQGDAGARAARPAPEGVGAQQRSRALIELEATLTSAADLCGKYGDASVFGRLLR